MWGSWASAAEGRLAGERLRRRWARSATRGEYAPPLTMGAGARGEKRDICNDGNKWVNPFKQTCTQPGGEL